MRPPPGEKEPEQQFSVDPTPSPSAYEWIIYIRFIIISFFLNVYSLTNIILILLFLFLSIEKKI
jgi:hypothetical protein